MTKESVKNFLIEAAKLKTPVTYSEVFDKHNLKRNPGTINQLSRILIKIGQEEYSSGRPLLNGLVVRKKTGLPGDGFFELLQELKEKNIPLGNTMFLKNLATEVFEECYNYYSS